MMAKPGRPARPKEKPARPAVKVTLPRGLTPAQRRHVAALAANATEQALVDEFAKALVLRDRCLRLIETEGVTVKTERHGTKLHPAHQALKDANLQMLAIRRLIERPKEPQPATPAASSAAEQRIQSYLAGDEMEYLIDDQGMPDGDASWRQDERVVAKRRQVQ